MEKTPVRWIRRTSARDGEFRSMSLDWGQVEEKGGGDTVKWHSKPSLPFNYKTVTYLGVKPEKNASQKKAISNNKKDLSFGQTA